MKRKHLYKKLVPPNCTLDTDFNSFEISHFSHFKRYKVLLTWNKKFGHYTCRTKFCFTSKKKISVNFVRYFLSGIFLSGIFCPVFFVRYFFVRYFFPVFFCPIYGILSLLYLHFCFVELKNVN